MPGTLLVIVPEPVPVLLTVSVYEVVVTLNVAVTVRAALIVTVHIPVPLQSPDQPVNVDPLLGVAVSVTEAPEVKLAEHVPPQLIPLGLVTVPVPVPLFETDRL
jgi:hypothetical protein